MIIDEPDAVNMVGSKWVFKVKKNAVGNIECYHTQLVAKGFIQVLDINYFNMFAPVGKLVSIQAVLATAAINDWETQQLDIKSACLNGELDPAEMIFMQQLPSYTIPGQK